MSTINHLSCKALLLTIAAITLIGKTNGQSDTNSGKDKIEFCQYYSKGATTRYRSLQSESETTLSLLDKDKYELVILNMTNLFKFYSYGTFIKSNDSLTLVPDTTASQKRKFKYYRFIRPEQLHLIRRVKCLELKEEHPFKSTTMAGKIFADFNNTDAQHRVRLNSNGSIRDIKANNIILEEGLQLLLDDGEELSAMGIAHFSKEENIWVATVDWDAF